MKVLLKAALFASAIVSCQGYAQDQDYQKRLAALREVRANFQTCMERTYQTPEGKIVGNSILLTADPAAREPRMDLMTSEARLDAAQKTALRSAYGHYLRCRQELLAGTQDTPFEPIDTKSFNAVDLILAKLLTGNYTIGDANIALAQVRNQASLEISTVSNLLEEIRQLKPEAQQRIQGLLQERTKFYRCMDQLYKTPEGQIVFGQVLVPINAGGNEKRMDLMTSTSTPTDAQKVALKDWPSRTAACERVLLKALKDTAFDVPYSVLINSVDVIIAKLVTGKYTIGEANVAQLEQRVNYWSDYSKVRRHFIEQLNQQAVAK